jgi:hypothetical protein
MKTLNFCLPLVCLFFSEILFSQTIKPGDLFGHWKWATSDDQTIYYFKSDTIYLQNSNYEVNKWLYKMDSLNNEYFIKTQPLGKEPRPQGIYKIEKNKQGIFSLHLIKIRVLDKKTKTWNEIDTFDKTAKGMIKVSNN